MRSRWLAVPIAAVAVALAACGSAGGSSTAGSGGGGATTGGSVGPGMAKGANPLCAKPSTDPHVSETLDSDPATDVTSASGLTKHAAQAPGFSRGVSRAAP